MEYIRLGAIALLGMNGLTGNIRDMQTYVIQML